MKKVLLINICREKLHYYEFVKPIEEILSEDGLDFYVKHYNDLKSSDLKKCECVIICGTSLYDNDFIKDVNYFDWLVNFDKPVLGICGGMQIIGEIFCRGKKSSLNKKTEIGFYFEKFKKPFLGLSGDVEVYHLHNNYIDFSKLSGFDVFSGKVISQAVKHKNKPFYGVLFHPEVRNTELILEFIKHG